MEANSINLDLIRELTSVPFNKVRNRIELLTQFEAIWTDQKLCRSCWTDRHYAWYKLSKYINEQDAK